MEGVDADGNPHRSGCYAAERPCLGGMSVDDRGSLGSEEPAQREQAPQIVNGPDLARHAGQEGRLHAALPRVP